MLASMSSVNEVGIFSVSFRFASVLMFVSAAFGQAWSPFAMKLRVDRPADYRELYGDILLILFFIMGFFGAVISLFSGEIIAAFIGEKYIDSGLSLIVLVFSIVFQSTQQITGLGISLEKKTSLFVHLSWITAGLNFIFNYLLIPYYGSLGASFATLISYMFLSGGYLYFTQKLHPIYFSYKKLVILILISVLILISSLFLFTTEFFFWTTLIKVGLLILFLMFGFIIIPYKKLMYVKN
jgi:O-antigen/teichoic acid export membrane protein